MAEGMGKANMFVNLSECFVSPQSVRLVNLTSSAWVRSSEETNGASVQLLLSATSEVTVKRQPVHKGGGGSSLTRNRKNQVW